MSSLDDLLVTINYRRITVWRFRNHIVLFAFIIFSRIHLDRVVCKFNWYYSVNG